MEDYPHTPPHPDASRLDLPPQAGRGKDFVLLGEFGRAHGLRGEVRLKSFTADPRAIASYGALTTDRNHTIDIAAVRPATGAAPDILVARVRGVDTREAAEALNRIRLYAPRDRLRPPEAEDEFLLADLVGLAVEDEAGRALGTVLAMPNYGGGDLVEICPGDGGVSALLPFTKAFVPRVDLAGGRLVVAAPADLFAPAKSGPEEAP